MDLLVLGGSGGAAKAAAETAVKGITPTAVIARTSLIIGDGDSPHERHVHARASQRSRRSAASACTAAAVTTYICPPAPAPRTASAPAEAAQL